MTIRNIKTEKLLSAKTIRQEDLSKIGGKAKSLFELNELGLNIPKWMVIPFDKVELTTDQTGLKFIGQIQDEIENQFTPETRFAVRSSAIQEDGINHSFAGQFITELNVGFEQLEDAILKVIKSTQQENVKTYCHENQIIQGDLKMSVIIQEMLNPDVSGVAFGINPVNGDRNEKIISAVFGLGESLVSGEVNADNYTIKNGIESNIVKKEKARVLSPQGTLLIDLPMNKQNEPCLNQNQITIVAKTLDVLKAKFGKAQDIEFAFVEDEFFLLQSRPITALNKLVNTNGERIIWDNSNIVESYPGVTSPLTFSFIAKVYDGAYVQISKIFGVSPKVIDNKKHVYQNLLGHLKGRVYYNLKNWYIMLAQLPGFKLNAGFMENMMGVKESFELEEENEMSKLEAWYRVFISFFKMLWQLFILPKSSRDFHKLIDDTIEDYDKIDFDKCEADELMKHYLSFENILLTQWKAPLVNDLFAMIFFGTQQKLSKKYFPENPSIGNVLIADSGDIISTQPAKRLMNISNLIQNNQSCSNLFKENEPDMIWKELNNYPEILEQINDYLSKFGDRCTGELKLETITYKQDPLLLIHIIKSYVVQGIKLSKQSHLAKEEALAEVEEKLKGKFFKKFLYKFILKKAKQTVSGRENLRFERTRGFAMVRKIFLAIGKHWYAEGIISETRDIFYLTQNEIFNFIKGTSSNGCLKELITLRKATYTQFEKDETPVERITTYGTVYHANDFYKKTTETLQEGDLAGIACCPGRITGKVQIIRDPSEIDSLDGDILVTTSTDPGWVALFPTASAILVERGSLLSHSAIVAREMGIPCIVGIPNLLKRLKTGEMVEMDGSTGLVKILN